jgi:hypothetical protein
MSAETEAECLLRSGRLYRRRAGLISQDRPLVFVGVKRGAFSVYDGDEPIYHFDLEGRWQRAYIDGTHYRKALDGSIDAIDRPRIDGSLVLSRHRLSFAEAADLDESIRQVALTWSERLANNLVIKGPPEGATALDTAELRELFDRAGQWNADAWFSQRERYLATYAPLDFLPPDDHQSVVLQATVDDRAFTGTHEQMGAARAPEEFRAHCRAVKSLLGRRLAQNRDVYLGGNSAIRGTIVSYFEIANEELPVVGVRDPNRSLAADEPELGTINLFFDNFRAGLPDHSTWSRLKSLHLGRVNLGITTGDDQWRMKLGLGGSAEEVADCVRVLQQHAVDLAMIIHSGGGESHVERTVSLIESLNLSRRDFVYLIDGRDYGLAVEGSANESDLESFKQQLIPLRKRTGLKVVPYSVEKQWN